MDYRTGFRDGYNAARDDILSAFGPGYLPISMETPLATSQAPMQANAPVAKKKRKPSKYNKAYGANYKRLRKKHPRAQHATLVTRAHAATRKQMKGK